MLNVYGESMLEYSDDEILEILKDKSVNEQLELLTLCWNENYGTITKYDNNLMKFSTGGWSDNERLIGLFCSPMNYRFSKHKIGYIRGGHIYLYFGNDRPTFDIIIKGKNNDL